MKNKILILLLSTTATMLSMQIQAKEAIVSYYGPGFHGKKTASGERFNMHGFSLAHKTLPFGTKVKIKCEATHKTVVARVNDRGPFVKGRTFDLSLGAAQALGIRGKGVAKIEYKILN